MILGNLLLTSALAAPPAIDEQPAPLDTRIQAIQRLPGFENTDVIHPTDPSALMFGQGHYETMTYGYEGNDGYEGLLDQGITVIRVFNEDNLDPLNK